MRYPKAINKGDTIGFIAPSGAVREEGAIERAKAEAEATERLDGLNEERETLSRQVAELKTAAANYRQQFEQLLQAQQEALEKAADLF